MSIIEQIISIISPHECLGCGAEGKLLCADCICLLPPVLPRCYRCRAAQDGFATCKTCRHSSALKRVVVATDYDTEQVKELIHGLKFARQSAAAGIIAEAMSALLVENIPDDVILTHVPTVNSRVRQRGYDQSRLIAQKLARLTGLEYSPLLLRIGEQRQVGQARAERVRQMKDAFNLPVWRNVTGKHIVLIDDVITTGATLEAAAQELKAAGAKTVSAIVFASA